MPKVSSSAIASIDYDSVSKNMYVQFHETGLYTYYNVPEIVYISFLNARSIGQFFNANIKDTYSK